MAEFVIEIYTRNKGDLWATVTLQVAHPEIAIERARIMRTGLASDLFTLTLFGKGAQGHFNVAF